MKPVKRELVALAELRPGDTCIIKLEPGTSLVVKVVEVRPTENILFYIPAYFSAVGIPEFIPAGDQICSSPFPPDWRFERIWLEAEEGNE